MLSFSCGVTVHSTAAASVSDGGMPPCTISQLRNCIVNSHAKMLLSSSAFSIFCRLRTLCFILIIKVSQSFISSRVLVCFDDARHFIFLSVSCGPLPWWWMSIFGLLSFCLHGVYTWTLSVIVRQQPSSWNHVKGPGAPRVPQLSCEYWSTIFFLS